MPAPTVSSNVPRAARKQVQDANRLIADLNARPGEVPRDARFQGEPRRAEWVAGQPGTPPPAAAPGPASVPAVVAPAPDPLAVAEQRYNSLAGKYNAEISRAAGTIEALRAENQSLLSRVGAPPAATPAPAAAPAVDLSMVSEKERTEYGEELVQMMARIAKANGGSEVARLQREIDQLKGGVSAAVNIAGRTLKERVWGQLKMEVPNWETINNSQQFLDWLEIPDIMSGVARRFGLTQAFETGDGTRVVGIFKRFIEEDSRARSAVPPPPNPALVDRTTLIAPGSPRGTGGEAPNSASGKVWSEQEIDDFYSRVQRKRINPDDAKAIEADILAAVRDGRVVPRRDDRFLANAR